MMMLLRANFVCELDKTQKHQDGRRFLDRSPTKDSFVTLHGNVIKNECVFFSFCFHNKHVTDIVRITLCRVSAGGMFNACLSICNVEVAVSDFKDTQRHVYACNAVTLTM